MYFANRSSLIYLGYSTHKEINIFLKNLFIKGEIIKLQHERFGTLATGKTMEGDLKTVFFPRYSYYENFLIVDAKCWKSNFFYDNKSFDLYGKPSSRTARLSTLRGLTNGKGFDYEISGFDFYFPNDVEVVQRYTMKTLTLRTAYGEYFARFKNIRTLAPRATGRAFIPFVLKYLLKVRAFGRLGWAQLWLGKSLLLRIIQIFKYMPKRYLKFVKPFYRIICPQYFRVFALGGEPAKPVSPILLDNFVFFFCVNEKWAKRLVNSFFLFFLLFYSCLEFSFENLKVNYLVHRLNTDYMMFRHAKRRRYRRRRNYRQRVSTRIFLPTMKKIN